jgi:hypothetical protein
MSKSIAATINIEIWNEELDADGIWEQIESLGWCLDSVVITHSDYTESESGN